MEFYEKKMRIVSLFVKIRHYIILTSVLIFILILPFDEYKTVITALFFWALLLGYLLQIIIKKISVDEVFKYGLTVFFVGVIIGSIGIMDIAELVLKLSFLLFFTAVIGVLVNYHSIE